MNAAALSIMIGGFGSVLSMLGYLIRRIVTQVDLSRDEIARLDTKLAVIETKIDNHEAAHMLSGHRLDLPGTGA